VTGGVTYDTGALIAAERNDRTFWRLHAAFVELEVKPNVPAAVLAEAWRGGARQAQLARALGLCVVEDLDAALARSVGLLAGASGHDDIVDVAVVEGAMRRGDVVVTSNRAHIEKIADAVPGHLTIRDI
jgi:hypothetical protein